MIAQGQKFNDLTIFLDGGTYTGCTFERCVLVVSGLLPIYFSGNHLIACRWEFAGPAATTIAFLTSTYVQGGGGKELVEKMFNNIRQNATGQRRSGDPVVLN